MMLPNGERAVIPESKLRDYVLSASHPVGRHHAERFRRLLGIGPDDWRSLQSFLQRAATEEQVEKVDRAPYGMKYVMRLERDSAVGKVTVIAVWIVDAGEDVPRLVTCYPE